MIYILGRCGVHPMQLSVIKFVSDLWQVGVFPGTSVSMTHDRSVVSPGVSDSQQVGDFTRYQGVNDSRHVDGFPRYFGVNDSRQVSDFILYPGVNDSRQVGGFPRYPGVFHKDSHDIIEKLLEAMFSIYLLK